MSRIINRIKISLIPTLSKQLLKIIVFCVLFSMFLSSLMIKQLGDYFSNFILDKIDLTVTVYSQVASSISDNTNVQFLHDREFANNYLNKSFDYITTVDRISQANKCNYQLQIQCDFIKPSISEGSLYNMSSDIIDLESTNYTNCIALDSNSFNSLRSNQDIKDNYVCILQKGASIIFENQDGTIYSKELQIGDKITLKYLIGYRDKAYLGENNNDNVIDKYLTFTIVGFTEDLSSSYFGLTNVIYIPLNNCIDIIQDTINTYNNDQQLQMFIPYYVSNAKITCDNLEQYLSVMKTLKQSTDSDIYYTSDASEMSGLLSIVSAITSNIDEITFIILLLMILTSILTALLNSFMRRKEIGLLSSFGESKRNISIQIIIEQFLILLVSIPLSLLTQKKVSQKIISYLSLNNYLQISNTTTYFSQRIVLNPTLIDYIYLLIVAILLLLVYGLIVYLTVKRNDPKQLMKG